MAGAGDIVVWGMSGARLTRDEVARAFLAAWERQAIVEQHGDGWRLTKHGRAMFRWVGG